LVSGKESIVKIGFAEWGFRELPMEEHFRICQRLGVKTLEIGIGSEDRMFGSDRVVGQLSERISDREIDDFRKMRDRYGIATPFCAMESDFLFHDPAAHERMLESVLRRLSLAPRIDATLVRLFAGFTPLSEMNEALWAQMLDAFQRCDEVCQELGLVIGIETHGAYVAKDDVAYHINTITTDHDSCARLVQELPERVGILYDPANIKAAVPDDKRYCLDVLNEHINSVHLKDWATKRDGWVSAALGDADLDYGPLLAEMQYDGVYLIEYEVPADLEDGLRRSLAHLESTGQDLVFA
jgi:sugar phosphate isomerase/epimerase